MEDQIQKIQLFEIVQNQEGISLSVTSEATLLLSKYKHNNILPICCTKSYTLQLLQLLNKNRADNFNQTQEQQKDIFLIDKPIPMKNDSFIILFEIPDEVVSIDAKDCRNSLQYIYLSFALYLAQYTLIPKNENQQMIELSTLEITRSFIQALKNTQKEQSELYSTIISDFEQLKNSIKFQPRSISGNPIKGEIALYMIYEFQQAYSQKKTIDITKTFESHSLIYFNKVKDDLFSVFLNKIKMQLSENNYPFDTIFIDSSINEIKTDLLHEYDQKVSEFSYLKQILTQRKSLEEKIKQEYEETIKKNDEISEEFCTNLLVQIYEYYKQQNLDLFTESQNNISETTIIEKQQIFQDLIKMYLSHARGPFKYKLLAETQTRFTFEFFDQFFKHLQEHFTNQLIQQKQQQSEIEERLVELEEKLKTSEQKNSKLEEENEKLEEIKKESIKDQQKLQEYKFGEESNQKEIKSLKEKIDKKQQKINKLQDELNKQLIEFKRQNQELSDKDFRLKVLNEKLQKVDEMTKSLFQSNNSVSSTFKSQNDMQTYLQDFKDYVQKAENSINRISSIRESLNSSQQFEIENIVKKSIKSKDKNQLQEEVMKARIEERENFVKERKLLEDQIHQLSKEKFDLFQQITQWKLKEFDFNKQIQIIQKQQECIETEQQKYNATMDYLQTQVKKFEEQGEYIFLLRQQLVDSQTTLGDQEMLIDLLYHLLPELILYMKKQQNKLANCLMSIQPYTNQVEQILKQNGLKI
ncbi:hypothetical protein TTHERM_00259430 (macronuclear) [Tetrahymena thermophila SB210]|uniref:Uncharacterized protein n=1 Tax=Tetrahymena thermophila (strain SB210) TaxID=312017 RepID=Q22UD9_TETTS|nr:hypothetical protein TTHERM_00259430 [Tetrahymena thermophila SB210]EAR88748.2 hypothetical protein TTHERM_00259430 [Tetrahymena thermophila SB210]|eukprot:XP_001008993.2 hypothetical protein TTHERM_00259430 [Tetrahymena thermophila SB210]